MSKVLNISLILVGVVFSSQAFAQVSGPQAVSGEYIIKYKSKPGVLAKNIKFVGSKSGLSVKANFANMQMSHVKVSSEAAKDALYSNPDIEFIEPNYILSVNPTDVSGLGSAPLPSDNYDQSDANVQVRQSWDIQKPYNQGSKVVVAVIDTGLDRNHNLFKDSGAIWENSAEKNGTPGVDDDLNGYVDDVNGWNFVSGNGNPVDDQNHGTHVSGIILGVGQDVRANPARESKIQIMVLKFLDSSGSGSTANAVAAINYAISKGAKVINNSWGGGNYSQALHEAYTNAYNSGIVITSAAGNDGRNNDSTPMYPSNLDTPNNLSVAATTDSDSKASFSNYGASMVKVAAPGVGILSSVPGNGCLYPGCFSLMSGTSMAAPFVAGLAALVFREAPQLSAYQVRAIVMGSVDTFSSLSGRVSTSGRVNAYKAIVDAKAQSGAASWTPAYSPDYSAARGLASEETQPVAGCGLVGVIGKELMNNSGGFGGGSSTGDLLSLLAIFMLPFVVAFNLRSRKKEVSLADRRVFQRYDVVKSAKIFFGGEELEIKTENCSIGGVAFNSEAQFAKGQIVQIQFAEAQNSQQVEAEVVWCAQAKKYGLRFLNATEALQFEIQSWTKGLVPIS